MIMRALTLAGGLAGAATSSQFPEFSQQYLQRLGGAVDELSAVAADFDATAAATGLTRQEALAQMTGTEFMELRQADMTRTFMRLDRLKEDLVALEGQGPFMRAYNLPRLTDTDIARAAWRVYEPAMPLNFAGLTFAGVGFLLASLVFGMILKMLVWPFRRRADPQDA